LLFSLPYVFLFHPAQDQESELAFSNRYTMVRSILRSVELIDSTKVGRKVMRARAMFLRPRKAPVREFC
jgi:hypothetical protein